MRRILVWLTGAVGVFLIVLALFLWFVHASLDAMVQTALETHGARLTGARVVVEDVDISPQSGAGRLRGVRIENPPGFSRANAMRFDEIEIRIDVATLTRDPLVIHELRVGAPHANVEVKPPGKSNIDVIRENLERAAADAAPGTAESTPGAAEAEPASDPATAPRRAVRRIVVRSLGFDGGRLDADARAVGGKRYGAALAPVRLADVGGPDGAPGDEVGRNALVAFTREVARSARTPSE